MTDSETMAPETCRQMARECYDLAKGAPDPDVRRRLLDLAMKWHELACRIEKDRAVRFTVH